MDERVITLENARGLQDILGHSLVKKARIPGHNTVPLYILLEELYIKISNGDILHIPEGFIWDLSSVPRVLWSLLPPDGDMEIGVIIHDYLYIYSNCFEYTQKFADKEMLLWSKALSGTKRRFSLRNLDNLIRYWGVRLGGFTKWKKRPCTLEN